jgi:hypothetical protein
MVSDAGNPYLWGRLSTIDLLALTSLDKLLLIFENIAYFFTRQAILKRRVTALSLSLHFPLLCAIQKYAVLMRHIQHKMCKGNLFLWPRLHYGENRANLAGF